MLLFKPKRNSSPTFSHIAHINHIQLKADEWRYVGEGGANVLFRFHTNGQLNSCFNGKILRIRKRDCSKVTQNIPCADPRVVVEYAENEIIPFLEKQQKRDEEKRYLQVAHLIQGHVTFLSQLNQQLKSLPNRPSHRQQSEIDVSSHYVMLIPDLTAVLYNPHSHPNTGPHITQENSTNTLLLSPRSESSLNNVFNCCFSNICIEIKPKIGFKPSKDLGVADLKTKVCRFCMHQQYKLTHGKIDHVSEYCPLDLFSKDPQRMRKALVALQKTPQNNFRAFIRADHGEIVDAITGLNADALPKGTSRTSCQRKRLGYRHSCQSIGGESELTDIEGGVQRDLIELLMKLLCNIRVLDDLREMQRLDHVNVEGMWSLTKLLNRVQDWTKEQSDPLQFENACLQSIIERMNVDTDLEFLSLVEALQIAIRFGKKANVCGTENVARWECVTLCELRTFYQHLHARFKIATTLKDCSLFFCLRRINDSLKYDSTSTNSYLYEYEHVIMFHDMKFHCVISVVDLDVKSHKSLKDYYLLDHKIVQFYKEWSLRQGMMDGARVCVE